MDPPLHDATAEVPPEARFPVFVSADERPRRNFRLLGYIAAGLAAFWLVALVAGAIGWGGFPAAVPLPRIAFGDDASAPAARNGDDSAAQPDKRPVQRTGTTRRRATTTRKRVTRKSHSSARRSNAAAAPATMLRQQSAPADAPSPVQRPQPQSSTPGGTTAAHPDPAPDRLEPSAVPKPDPSPTAAGPSPEVAPD